jgi:hypothetical protein
VNASAKVQPVTPVHKEEAQKLLDKFQERYKDLFAARAGAFSTRFKKGFFHV